MTQSSNERGMSFQERVGELLADLQSQHPDRVTIVPQFELKLRTERVVKPDFMMKVRHQHVIDMQLIECQSREKSDHSLSDKIGSIRRDSEHNRFIFVYESAISEAVRHEFRQHGTNVYSFEEFRNYITETGKVLSSIRPPPFFCSYGSVGSPSATQSAATTQAYQPQVHKGQGKSPGLMTKDGSGRGPR